MVIPSFGFIIIIFVLMAFFVKPGMLIYLCAFFVPFSGASVINIPSFEFAIVPFTFTAFIWLSFYIIGKILLPQSPLFTRGPMVPQLLLFLAVITLSLIMPFIIDGKDQFEVAGILISTGSYKIQFSFWYVVHSFYVALGVLFVIIVSEHIAHYRRLESMVKWYLLGGGFAAIIGLLESITNFTGHIFPIEFFNTVPTINFAGMQTSRFDGQLGLVRISSVAEEPSLFGTHLSVIFAILWAYVTCGKTIISKRVDIILIFLIGSALILTLSTVAYLGLGLTISINTLFGLQKGSNIFRNITLFILLAACLALTIFVIPDSTLIIENFIFSKDESGSFLERITTVTNAFSLALRYPILGVGWGVVPSFDLFVKIFVGAGVLGLFSFLLLLKSAFNTLRNVRSTLQRSLLHENKYSELALARGLLIALLTLTVIYVVGGFQYRYGDFWVLLTLISAIQQRTNANAFKNIN